MWYGVFLWALVSSLSFHAPAALLALFTLRRHKYGRFMSLGLLLMGIVGPITAGILTSTGPAPALGAAAAPPPPACPSGASQGAASPGSGKNRPGLGAVQKMGCVCGLPASWRGLKMCPQRAQHLTGAWAELCQRCSPRISVATRIRCLVAKIYHISSTLPLPAGLQSFCRTPRFVQSAPSLLVPVAPQCFSYHAVIFLLFPPSPQVLPSQEFTELQGKT